MKESDRIFISIRRLRIAYFISCFIGAAFFPEIHKIEYSALSLLSGFAFFFFLGPFAWPVYSVYNIFTFFVFSILLFLFLSAAYECIIGLDRKGGDLPMDENGLMKRLKRARMIFQFFVLVVLVIVATFVFGYGI